MFNFKWLSNTPIFRRLFLAFAIAAIIPSIIISILASTYIHAIDTRNQAVQTSNTNMEIANSQLSTLQRMNTDMTALHATKYFGKGAGITSNDTALITKMGQNLSSEINKLQMNFTQTLTNYQQNYQIATSSNMANVHNILATNDPTGKISQDQQQTLARVADEWHNYQQAQQQELIALETNQLHAVTVNLLVHANTLYIPLEQDWQHIIDISKQVGDRVAQLGSSQTETIILAAIVAIISTIIVVMAIGYIVNQTITRPLRQLATLTRRIAKGETSARANIPGRDEIYMVATSMNNMLDNIVRLISETQAQRDGLQGQVEKLVSEVSGVGEGDLRVQAEVTADALGVLADSFNYMVEELGSLIVRVKMVAHEVENSTVTILDRMTQLVETGDLQINQITEAAIEVEHMSDFGRQVADRALTLSTVARGARKSAQEGRDSVQQAVEGMGRIHENVQTTASKVQTLGERSREINNIVEVIANIAHQTNRLALDAAIQAAMAGENGKGFGAVAADIRRLAERAKEQASSIARIVRSVREDIGAAAVSMQDTERETSSGSRLTQEAGLALESIFSTVEHQAKEIETINQMAMHQLQSSSMVVQIMQAISESTKQSNVNTREASQNMQRLARLVEQLRGSTEAFKLRENSAYYVPTSNISISEDEQDNQVTISGLFRTVTSTALPTNMRSQQALPEAKASDPFASYPMKPNFQNDEWDNSMTPEQQWYEEPFNQRTSNGSHNR